MVHSDNRERKYARAPLSAVLCIAVFLVFLPCTSSKKNQIVPSLAYAEPDSEQESLVSSATFSAPDADEKAFEPPGPPLERGLSCDEAGQQTRSPAEGAEQQQAPPEKPSTGEEGRRRDARTKNQLPFLLKKKKKSRTLFLTGCTTASRGASRALRPGWILFSEIGDTRAS